MKISDEVKALPTWAIGSIHHVKAKTEKEAIDQMVAYDTDNIQRRVLMWEGIVSHSHDIIQNLDELNLENDDVVILFNKDSSTATGLVYTEDGQLMIRWLKDGGFVSLKLLQADVKLNGFFLHKV